MASAKEKFYSDGAYEFVCENKSDRPMNQFGHSPFTKDSYLSTHQRQESDGADGTDDHQHPQQEDFSFMSKSLLDEQSAAEIQDDLADDSEPEAQESDNSSVDEDDPPPTDSA